MSVFTRPPTLSVDSIITGDNPFFSRTVAAINPLIPPPTMYIL